MKRAKDFFPKARQRPQKSGKPIIIKGNPVSPGIAHGKALLFNSQREIILREKIDPASIEKEINRFNNAVKKSRAQLKKISHDLRQAFSKEPALIIDTQHLLLEDGNLIDDIKNNIVSQSVRAEYAIEEVEKKYIDIFDKIPDLAFKGKINDISDVLTRVSRNLKPGHRGVDIEMDNVILVADNIPPSIAATLMSRGKLLGLILDEGGETAHTVILARTLEIPVIVNTRDASRSIANDDLLILDGLNGEVTVNPDQTALHSMAGKKEKYRVSREKLKEVIQLPDRTRDDHPFTLLGNIEFPFESDLVQSHGARGLGLFRTEFLFTDPAIALSTEQQYLIYKNIAQKIYPHPVVIRTFDVGRDKTYSYFKNEKEVNPALGTMAVRLFLREQDIFKTQIRAILMANESGNIKILFPMITEIEEIWAIKKIVQEIKEELISRKKYPQKDVDMGIMIEIPGTVKLIRYLRHEVDFFSIGTNDLIQYLLAVDRGNGSVSYLYSPFHPAVLQTLRDIQVEAAKIDKPVTICGEMAGKPCTALMLLGLGFENFSMNPLAIAEIKSLFTQVHLTYLQEVVADLFNLGSKTEIEERLNVSLLARYPGLFPQKVNY